MFCISIYKIGKHYFLGAKLYIYIYIAKYFSKKIKTKQNRRHFLTIQQQNKHYSIAY